MIYSYCRHLKTLSVSFTHTHMHSTHTHTPSHTPLTHSLTYTLTHTPSDADKRLKEEGLLRKCGSASRVKAMANNIEMRFHCGGFSLTEYMASDKERKTSDVTSLLKQFLR